MKFTYRRNSDAQKSRNSVGNAEAQKLRKSATQKLKSGAAIQQFKMHEFQFASQKNRRRNPAVQFETAIPARRSVILCNPDVIWCNPHVAWCDPDVRASNPDVPASDPDPLIPEIPENPERSDPVKTQLGHFRP